MIFAGEVERYIAGPHIFGIVECKFRHRQEPYQVVLLLINKSLEICLYCVIVPLSLTLCL